MSEFKVGDRIFHSTLPEDIGYVLRLLPDGDVKVEWEDETSIHPTHNLHHDPTTPEPLLDTLDRVSERVRGEDAEVRTTSSAGAEKGVKAEAFSLLPVEALEKVARHYRIGAEKYAAHNWRAGYEWSKSYDALQRHANAFWRGEDMDAETGSAHMAAVAFHALALLTFMDEQPGFDDRYTP